jgi:hypothetical protein
LGSSLDFHLVVVDKGTGGLIGVGATYYQCWSMFKVRSTHNLTSFTAGIGRGYWKIHVYSGLSHLSVLLFEGIVSYGGTPVGLGIGMSDGRVTLTKGVARMLCIRQPTKRNERVTKGENILEGKLYQPGSADGEAS